MRTSTIAASLSILAATGAGAGQHECRWGEMRCSDDTASVEICSFRHGQRTWRSHGCPSDRHCELKFNHIPFCVDGPPKPADNVHIEVNSPVIATDAETLYHFLASPFTGQNLQPEKFESVTVNTEEVDENGDVAFRQFVTVADSPAPGLEDKFAAGWAVRSNVNVDQTLHGDVDGTWIVQHDQTSTNRMCAPYFFGGRNETLQEADPDRRLHGHLPFPGHLQRYHPQLGAAAPRMGVPGPTCLPSHAPVPQPHAPSAWTAHPHVGPALPPRDWTYANCTSWPSRPVSMNSPTTGA